jgi:hypothetical protein
MNDVIRRRLPFILTGALVLLAVVVVSVFLATGGLTPTAAPSPTPTRAAGSGSEVLPPTATPTTPHLGVDPTPLVTAPLPKTASATGKLVTGFPSGVISIPADTKVTSSAISTQGNRMQATLVGTSAAPVGDVLSYFEAACTKLGLTSTVTPSAPGTQATSCARGNDRITVTTEAQPGGTRFTIFALFTAGEG